MFVYRSAWLQSLACFHLHYVLHMHMLHFRYIYVVRPHTDILFVIIRDRRSALRYFYPINKRCNIWENICDVFFVIYEFYIISFIIVSCTFFV